MKLDDKIYTLHCYFIWADKMRTNFDLILRKNPNWESDRKAQIESRLYMSYWYAGLYVVIEGWRELKLQDEKIGILLQSPNTNLLHRYRNGVFHFQAKYDDPRFEDFYNKAQEPVKWVRELNSELGRYFLSEIRRINQKEEK